MTELLFCTMLQAITVQQGFTALRRGRGGETKTNRDRARAVQEEWDRRQLTPPLLLLLPAEWEVLHFLRAMQRTGKKKLTPVKVIAQQRYSEAAGAESWWQTEKVVPRQAETQMDAERQMGCSIEDDASAVQWSASHHQRTEVGINHFHTRKTEHNYFIARFSTDLTVSRLNVLVF